MVWIPGSPLWKGLATLGVPTQNQPLTISWISPKDIELIYRSLGCRDFLQVEHLTTCVSRHMKELCFLPCLLHLKQGETSWSILLKARVKLYRFVSCLNLFDPPMTFSTHDIGKLFYSKLVRTPEYNCLVYCGIFTVPESIEAAVAILSPKTPDISMTSAFSITLAP